MLAFPLSRCIEAFLTGTPNFGTIRIQNRKNFPHQRMVSEDSHGAKLADLCGGSASKGAVSEQQLVSELLGFACELWVISGQFEPCLKSFWEYDRICLLIICKTSPRLCGQKIVRKIYLPFRMPNKCYCLEHA